MSVMAAPQQGASIPNATIDTSHEDMIVRFFYTPLLPSPACCPLPRKSLRRYIGRRTILARRVVCFWGEVRVRHGDATRITDLEKRAYGSHSSGV
jgi:hypothetical protein